MAKFLVTGCYTAEGAKGLAREGGSARREAVEQMVRAMDGKVEVFYYAFGKPDVYVIVDVPDAASAAAVSLAVNATGAVELSTTPLITPEEMDAASKKSVSYRPPGK